MPKPNTPFQGQQVTYSGFPFAIVRQYSTFMYEIRNPSGVACVDGRDILNNDPRFGQIDQPIVSAPQPTR